MDPARETLCTGVYPSISGHPEGARPDNTRGCQLRKQVACTVALTVVLGGLIVAVVVLAGRITATHGLPLSAEGHAREWNFTSEAWTVSVLVSKAPPQLMPWCPDGWLGYQGKCYYFSEVEQNWIESRTTCSAFGALLAAIDSEQELAFMMRYKGISEHWIGLWKEPGNQPWKWVNGSDFNSMLVIRGGGNCAYLSDESISSSRCTTDRNWVCSKPDAHTVQQSATLRSQELQHP